jgi:hypothetical protein
MAPCMSGNFSGVCVKHVVYTMDCRRLDILLRVQFFYLRAGWDYFEVTAGLRVSVQKFRFSKNEICTDQKNFRYTILHKNLISNEN